MSLSYMKPDGLIQVPSSSGGVNLELINRVSALESRIEELSGRLIAAGKNNLGLVRLSDASTVTQLDGYALPATEKNAAIAGSLANEISNVRGKTEKLNAQMVSPKNPGNFSYHSAQIFKIGNLGICNAYVVNTENPFGNVVAFYFPEGFYPNGYYYKYGVCKIKTQSSSQIDVLQTFINPENNSFSIAQNVGNAVQSAVISFAYKIRE